MRYLSLLLIIICCHSFAEDMVSLKKRDFVRQNIAEDLRREENLKNAVFHIKRVNAGGNIAYFCALIKDKKDNYIQTGNNKYHLYDRIMLSTDNGWISATRLDSEVDTPERAHCFYAPEVILQSESLMKRVEQEGRKDLCQPVHKGDPLRMNILNALRASYRGDSNRVELNGTRTEVTWVVKELCASEKYAWFFGHAIGDRQSVYSENKENIEVILRAEKNGEWHTMPRKNVLTQQSAVSWPQNNGYLSAAMLEKMAQRVQQRCALEGDTVRVSGRLQEAGNAADAYWVIIPDEPFVCVRDADTHLSGWNSRMQLLLTKDERKLMNDLLGQNVHVGGDILLALSTHHHTALLLNNIFLLKAEK
ncbi:DUF4431 domain-containing protein [Enterobacter quasihormaechei]|uniref:DUF4431 domain-containing protein n=1 Tax=Enterobacter quasihormaechei TaxID=2529382 RepID=A0AAE8QXS5_9ENTR|nr:DUF4431 domain-containing protein [Enterobacter quasihormaechei]TCB88114.1 DUF4431 domain-containing protein [Enterobacter quasihormaechei]